MILGTTHCLAVMAALVLGVAPQQVNNVKTGNTVKTNTSVTTTTNNINTNTVKPTGEYAKIDVQLTNDAINVLTNGTTKQKQATITRIIGRSDKFAPIVFCALAKELWKQGNKDEAVFWYYAGTLRCQYDAQRCIDKTVGKGVATINKRHGTPIIAYATKNPTKFETIINKVVDWDRKTPYNYDQRWINLYGDNVIMATTSVKNTNTNTQPLSVPKSQWKQIAEKNRMQYVNSIRKSIEEVKNQPVDAKAPIDNTL